MNQEKDYERYVNPLGNVYSKKISLGDLLKLVTIGKTRVHMTHVQYEPAVFSIFPRKSEEEQTNTTEPKQTSSSKTIDPIGEAEGIDKSIPFAIEVISHFLEIEVSKGDTVYNPGGAKIDGFSYDLISKCIKEAELFPDGRRGNSAQKKKANREEDLKKMKDMFLRKEYQKLKDDFGKIR